jgi:hypothetical protein
VHGIDCECQAVYLQIQVRRMPKLGAHYNRGRRLVGLAVAAEYADVSTRTLRRYISHGRLTGYCVGPRLIKVDLNELDAMARPIPTARGPG